MFSHFSTTKLNEKIGESDTRGHSNEFSPDSRQTSAFDLRVLKYALLRNELIKITAITPRRSHMPTKEDFTGF